jgi:manganese transport protein
MMGMVLQALAAKLGIVTGLDLAQACRERYSPSVRVGPWLLCEIAIVACDLAEVIGTAIALKLLFGLPLVYGVLLTTLDVFLILALQGRGVRRPEAFVIATIAICFAIELLLAQPDLVALGRGFLPDAAIVSDSAMLYLSIGIVGATVMPHNLYLHSSLVKSRCLEGSDRGKRQAIRLATLDCTLALGLAFLINAAILMLAAATFHAHGHSDMAEIQDAYRLLSTAVGAGVAGTIFAVALLASGQNATITGTLAGQIVLEGFTNLRVPAWARRLISRLLAVVPAAFVAILYGDSGTTRLLILSQVVLSLQLPFAVVPLLRITDDRMKMGMFANRAYISVIAWGIAALLIMLNGKLIISCSSATTPWAIE